MIINQELAYPEAIYSFDLNTQQVVNLAKKLFGIKIVCMQGSGIRSFEFAKRLMPEFANGNEDFFMPVDLIPSSKFNMYRVGDILLVSHGMGNPSALTLLHDITKLMHYAGNKNMEYIRIGTSGGLGIEPGTVVITDTAYMPNLQPFYKMQILDKEYNYPTEFDVNLNKRIVSSQSNNLKFKILCGNTICANDFYLGQARFDGVIQPDYNEKKRAEYFARAKSLNILNFEMESSVVASFCLRANIPAAMIAVTLLDRTLGDQVNASSELLEEFSDRVQQVAINYLRSVIK